MNIDELINELSRTEKASLTAGADMWSTVAIERVGIPALKMTDGPNGARGSALLGAGSVTAACIPCGSALGATWNPRLIERVGNLIGEEARTKGCRILLAPTINLHRSPLGGRNFECYSEDPLLTGHTAAAFIRGVQARGVAATAKHFVANDAEHERYMMSSIVDDRTLREIYLLPFEMAVVDGGALAVMTGYNRVNGVYCSEHHELLQGILKEEWGFDGIVMTDWFSAGDTRASALAGLDLQMPGPARFFGPALETAVDEGSVSDSVLDNIVRRLLGIVEKTHAWEDQVDTERSEDRPEHRAVAREAACEAAVLLTNDGILPADPTQLKTIAAIGPGWAHPSLMGGGSAQLRPHYRIAPLEVLRQRAANASADEQFEILHEPGCVINRSAPTLDRFLVRTPEGEPGFALEFFAEDDHAGPVIHRGRSDDASLMYFGAPASGVPEASFSLRARGVLTVERSGAHTLTLTQAGRARLLVDGKVLLDGFADPPPRGKQFFGMGSEEIAATIDLDAGKPVDITIEYSSQESFILRGVQIGYRPPEADDMIADAAAAAARADVAVVLVGTNHEWESEGHDRADMELPRNQNELIERVVDANPNTVVLINTGAPVTMDWADKPRATMQVWLAGQEMAAAIVDLIFGDAEPAGRLPTTIPQRLEHNPSYGNFPGENGEVVYGERLMVGYRWYDTRAIDVRFPFGHGMSYSTFRIDPPRLSAEKLRPRTPLQIEVDVSNTGNRRGAEVVQCYVSPHQPRLTRPAKELKAFEKVWLEPGETRTVTLTLDERAFAHWDPCYRDHAKLVETLGAVASMLPGGLAEQTRTEPGWYVDAGTYDIHIGRSSADLQHSATAEVTDEIGPLVPRRTKERPDGQ